jgi:hypothetical protein
MIVAHFAMNYQLFYEIKTKHTFCTELVITLVVFSNTAYKNIL